MEQRPLEQGRITIAAPSNPTVPAGNQFPAANVPPPTVAADQNRPPTANVPPTTRQGPAFDPFDPANYPPTNYPRDRRSSYEPPSVFHRGYFEIPRERSILGGAQDYHHQMERQQVIHQQVIPRQYFAILRPTVYVTHNTPLEVVCLHSCVCGRTFAGNPHRVRIFTSNDHQLIGQHQPLQHPQRPCSTQQPSNFRRQDEHYEAPAQSIPYNYWNQSQARR